VLVAEFMLVQIRCVLGGQTNVNVYILPVM